MVENCFARQREFNECHGKLPAVMQEAEKKASAIIKSAERERQQAQGNSALARQAFDSQLKVIGSFIVSMGVIKCTAGLRLVIN